MQLVVLVVVAAVKDDGCVYFCRTAGRSEKLWGSSCTVNVYMYKTIQARVNTVAIPTTGKSCSLYRELLKPLWVIYQ